MLERLADILRQAGTLLLNRRTAGDFTCHRNGVNVSASVDLDAHRLLVKLLSELSPGVAVLSEEDAQGHTDRRPALYWLIDPLDGTASFVDGFSGFVTQAALIRSGQLVLAGVYAPMTNEMFLAEAGAGATRNGLPISVKVRPRNAWVITDNYPAPRGIAADLVRDWTIPGYLESGSIGLKICRVAEGRADLFVKDVPVRDWDVAAPALVLDEAGGSVSDGAGRPLPYSGEFEHFGLIACAAGEAIGDVAAWIEERRCQKSS